MVFKTAVIYATIWKSTVSLPITIFSSGMEMAHGIKYWLLIRSINGLRWFLDSLSNKKSYPGCWWFFRRGEAECWNLSRCHGEQCFSMLLVFPWLLKLIIFTERKWRHAFLPLQLDDILFPAAWMHQFAVSLVKYADREDGGMRFWWIGSFGTGSRVEQTSLMFMTTETN